MLRFFQTVLFLMITAPAFAQAPNWSVDPADFSSTMSVVGMLSVDGLPAMSANDQIAAFVGEDIRGVASPTASSGQFLFILTIHANAGGEQVVLKAYLADEDIVVDIKEDLSFEVNGVMGTPLNPLAWTATRGTGPCAAPRPDWAVDASLYASSMSVTVRVESASEPHEADILAAFVGEEIRGVAMAQVMGEEHVFFLTVHGNANGELLSFQYYDAQVRALLTAQEELSFIASAIEGSAVDPFRLQAHCTAKLTSIDDTMRSVAVKLEPAYPNPFHHSTTIRYILESPAQVEVVIYDVLGREVEQLVAGHQSAGEHALHWLPGDLPAGLYLYRLQVGHQSSVRRMSYLK